MENESNSMNNNIWMEKEDKISTLLVSYIQVENIVFMHLRPTRCVKRIMELIF